MLVIFAGWGMDYRLFDHLRHGAYDILVVWDYRQLYSEEYGETRPYGYLLSRVAKYAEVCLIAWSFGVYAAQQVMEALAPKLSRCIAVNGTVTPIHDELGIPEATFRGTLENLDQRNWQKFFRRVCGTPERMAEVEKNIPKREIDDLIEELRILGQGALQMRGKQDPQPHRKWDVAVVSTHDAIFPVENQRKAWQANTIVEVDGPHLPDFQSLIDKYIIDKFLVAKRFSEAFSTYSENASVQGQIAQHLIELLRANDLLRGMRGKIIEIGCGTCDFTRLYAPEVNCRELELWDIADVPESCVPDGAKVKKCDAEMELRNLVKTSVDAILSNCAVQWFGSAARFLRDCFTALRSRGILAFTTFDQDNLKEMQALGTSQLTTPSLEEWQALMPEGMRVIVAERNQYTLYFPTPRAVLEHLRLTGVNALAKPSVGALRDFIAHYPHQEEGYPLTYSALSLVCQKVPVAV